MKLSEHPTVKSYRARAAEERPSTPLDQGELRQLCLEGGVDDVGFVDLESPACDALRDEVSALMPGARTILSLVVRLNPDNIRCASARSVADTEFLYGFSQASGAARRVTKALMERGARAIYPSPGFPMELQKFPDKMWPLSHKLVAEAAGMGKIGHHRLLIHPRFGSFVVLESVLTDARLTGYDEPLGFDPCLECKLCALVCPTGAIANDGVFTMTSCLVHNYRDRLGGFADWAEAIAASSSVREFRQRVRDNETVSLWQSLTVGISNKCSYCMSVCPAGEENVGPYVEDKKAYREATLKPLQDKVETVYVVKGSDAEAHLGKRFPHKEARRVRSGVRPTSIEGFLKALPHVFHRGQAKGLAAVYHLEFTGDEQVLATVEIRDKKLSVEEGHRGSADLRVTADSRTWLDFLAGEKNIALALLSRKIRFKGKPSLMPAFARCFPL